MVFCYKMVNFQMIIINIRKTQKRIELWIAKRGWKKNWYATKRAEWMAEKRV